MTADPVAGHAATRGDHPAVICGAAVRTYAALDARANQLARALAARGAGPDERVAVMLPSSVEWFEASVAAARLGAQLVPVNWHLTGDEVAWILADSGARVLLTHTDLADDATAALAAVPGCAALWAGEAGGHGDDGYEAALAAESPAPLDRPAGPAPGLMLYTSGTTGRPKGVQHRRAATARSRQVLADLWGFGPDDVHLLAGPAYHGAPWSMAYTHVTLGATLVVLPRWNARSFLELVDRHRVTTTFLVPTHFTRLLDLPAGEVAAYDRSSLRLVLHGAAACPVAVKERAIAWFAPAAVWEFYGFSEGGRITRIGPDEWRAHPGSVGRPIEGVHVLVVDDDGRPCPPGEAGWVYAVPASRDRFAYRNNPDATAAVTLGTEHGTAVTGGDIGYLDADGYLYLTDRSAELVVRGGVNLYPSEAEQALHRHPAVLDCAAFGVPDPVHGEHLVALVELTPGATVTPAELDTHCRAHLAGFKCPEEIRIVDALPRDPNGKVRKHALRDAARDGSSTLG